MTPRNTVCLITADTALGNSLKNTFKSANLNLFVHATVKEFLAAHDEDQPVGCVVTTLNQGVDVLKDLVQGHCIIPLVLLAQNPSVPAVVQAIKSGAFDVVERSDLIDSVKKATSLFVKCQKLFEERADASQRIGSLTRRESQVFNLMVLGLPNREIAEQIGISPKTLDIHRSNLMWKMNAKTGASLVRANLLDKTNPMLLPLLLS